MDKEKNKKVRILIVDDEPLIRESLFEILRIEGFKVQMAPTGEEAFKLLSKTTMDIVVTDLKLPVMSGLDLLEKIRDDYPKTETILMTGYGSIETAVEAMKVGAFDYITKPINDHEIKIVIQKIVEKKEILDENESLRKLLADGSRNSFCGMIGSSSKMQHVYQTVEAVATTNATILITGESGTGKGMVARAIHESDQNRHKHPFVEVSCGALSETLLESELFGHVKGAFTGAIKDKEGRFEYANGGTIFLDEIDAFTPNLQVKLLKVLQDNVFERVGDNVTKKGDFRIVVATNQDLVDLVRKGDFREDLYYRINVISIVMPSLRDRLDDIELISRYYINKYSDANNKSVRDISPEVLSMFEKYNWPGNIRELENAL
ncbi:Response regulator of zinc sigma-54-dependent two-component system, partial [hydrothermal vent metagenome]